MSSNELQLDTVLVHGPNPASNPHFGGAVVTPIFQSSTFHSDNDTAGNYDAVKYLRLSNSPSHELIHSKIAALEGAEAALVTSSGMSAITTTLLALLKAGDHVLAQKVLYGGTLSFLHEELPRFGIEVTFFDPTHSPDSWTSLVRANTRLVYTEAVTNPLNQVADHEAVLRLTREHKLISVIDGTLLSPVFFRPVAFGYDLVVHSATKYYNGHSDIVAGVIAGKREYMSRINTVLGHLGGSLDPNSVFLLNRGLQTLSLRVEKQAQNALILAQRLESHPAVRTVHFSGLESHPHHVRAKSLFSGFGALLCFDLHAADETVGLARAKQVINGLHLFSSAPSLGGTETLITVPAATSHATLTPEERASLGISLSLIRVAVGIENIEDLWTELNKALNSVLKN